MTSASPFSNTVSFDFNIYYKKILRLPFDFVQFLDASEAFRGCMSDPIEDGRDFCMKDPEHCTRCKDRACNAQKLEFEKPLSCIKCIPDELHNCNIIDKNTTAIACARTVVGYKNFCYTHHTEQTVTRGCLYEATDSIFGVCKTNTSALCTICNQTDCNRAPITNATVTSLNTIAPEKNTSYDRVILPVLPNENENRLHCYQCNGTKECDFIGNSEPLPCPISSKYDQCFTFIQHKGIFISLIFVRNK